jgi:putative membrane protein
MDFLYLKSLHIVFVVTWFAGLFYIVRLFIYHTEANQKQEPDRTILSKQFRKMERLLWYVITWPSAILTLIFGTWTLLIVPHLLNEGFMHVKLTLVALLYIYQIITHRIYIKLRGDRFFLNSTQLRMWNEIPTVLLISVVFLIVLKSTLDMVWGVTGFLVVVAVLMVAIRVYKKYRKTDEE